MTERPEPVSDERIVFQGKIQEVVRQDMEVGDEIISFEWARRAPGTRIIVDNGEEILLTHEYRNELEGMDYRLPGGKVFDSLDAYNSFLDSEEDVDIIEKAEEAARAEAAEEAGIIPDSIEFYKQNHSGATVEWDLFYFVVNEFEEGEQNLELGEDIEEEWRSHDEVRKMCLDGIIQEDRTVAVLLQYLDDYEKV